MGLMRKMMAIRFKDVKHKNNKDLVISLLVLFLSFFMIIIFIYKGEIYV